MDDVFVYEAVNVAHEDHLLQVFVFESDDEEYGISVSCEFDGVVSQIVPPTSNQAAVLMNGEVAFLLNRICTDTQNKIVQRLQARSGEGIDIDRVNTDDESSEGFEFRSQTLPTWEDSVRFVLDRRFRDTKYVLDDDNFYARIGFSREPDSRWVRQDGDEIGLGVIVSAPIATRLFQIVGVQVNRMELSDSD